MIKGCNKRVIVMKDTGNSMVEEAFFILKPGSDSGSVSERDILKHANSILAKSSCVNRFSSLTMNVTENSGRKKEKVYFGLGVFVGVLVAFGFSIIF